MIEGMEILGENLNATRKLLKTSRRLIARDGKTFLRYGDADGREAFLDLTAAKEKADANSDRLLPHVAEGVRRRDARWAQGAAAAQIRAGADFIDLCVDEMTTHSDQRWEHLRWLIDTVAPVVGDAPVAIDSSDSELIRRGLARLAELGKRAMVNSINLEPDRQALAPDAARYNALVVAGASGRRGLPASADERVANLDELQAVMDAAGIPPPHRYLDPLVLPIATDPENGNHFFHATRALRAQCPGVHIIGGLSNVSFGLPNRAALNRAMMWLFRKYGGDAAIVDPLQVEGFQTDDPAFSHAVEALEGRDLYCAEYVAFCRGQSTG